MKKNKMMRAASFLLVAVLLTTSVISGTFAKYVTTATGSDTARVAKFGVEITANGETFAKTYARDDMTLDAEASSRVGVNSVASDNKVVAPGTSGKMASMTLTGTPEVAVKVTYEADVDISDNWNVDSDFYFPLIITINGVQYSAEGTGCVDAAAFEAYLEGKIAEYSKYYAAGQDLANYEAESLAISWEWPFSTSEGNDVKDTFLGGQAAAGNPATITLTVKTTVTQVD